LILFVLFPWAETRRDPDAIQAPAWFLALFLIVLAVVFGGTAVAAAAFSKDRDI
jgi:high-affinity Fe2+/Pb2+ permease